MHVDSCLTYNEMWNLECAILSPDSNKVAIPDVVTSRAVLDLERNLEIIILHKNVLLVFLRL